MIERLLHYFIRSQLLIWLVIVGLLLGGLMALFGLQREAYPRVDFHQAVITTVFPGAAPEDVEQRVTIPLEEEIREVEGLKRVRSTSRHSVSEIFVEVDLKERDPDGVLDEVRRALDRVTDLPSEVTERPVFQEQKTGTFPVLEISLYGANSEQELTDIAEFYEKQLEKLPGVARVDLFGKREHEWQALLNPNSMRARGVSMLEVVQSLAARNVNIPGGALEAEQARNIRTTGEFQNIGQLARVPVQSNDIGSRTMLGQIARFEEGFESPRLLARTNGQNAINLMVLKRERSDIVTVTGDVAHRLEELKQIRPIQSAIVLDEARQTRRRLSVVQSNAAMGFVLVVAMLIAFLNFRTALVTAGSLPLVVLGSLIFFPQADITFNMISMMGLIISLGMLVDNSIVIAENVHRYREQGYSPIEAATHGAAELVIPILGSFLTTVAAFVPMLLMTGIMGKFIWQIPFLVIVSLSVSLLESFFLLPARLARFSEKEGQKNSSELRQRLDAFFDGVASGFGGFVRFLAAHPFRSFAVMSVVVLASFVGMAFMKFSLFPKEEVEQFIIRMEFEPSLRVTQTVQRMSAVESLVRGLPADELVSYSVKAGIQQIDAGDPLTRVGEHLAMVNIYLTPESERKRTAKEIIDALTPAVRQTPGLIAYSLQEVVPSPPVGAAITVAVEGPEYEKLREISAEVRAYLATIRGVKNIADDYRPGREEIIVRLNEERAATAGVSDQLAAQMVRSAYEGAEATTLRQGDREITIRVRYDEPFRRDLAALSEIAAPNRVGLRTTLGSISTLETRNGPESLSHYDFERAITILADVDEDIITSSEANALIFARFKDLSQRYPGYALKLRGEEQETNESMASLAQAGGLALLAIFGIIALIFNSPLRALIIMMTVPLGLTGIVIGFLTAGKALSFLALIGIIGLAGVQVNAGIMLVEFIDKARREDGLGPLDAVVDAARTRFRPILLTSLTTMAGLFPTAYALGGSDPVLIPMTLALAWGLASGTFGSLLFIPVVFSCGYKLRELWLSRRGSQANPSSMKTLSEAEAAARLGDWPQSNGNGSPGANFNGKVRRSSKRTLQN
ncbi:MAG: efflux RND transporter permease subunit [Leptospirales bacterium]|nr:efflux RND transporter permease subunit [Leptospirales bacterium]